MFDKLQSQTTVKLYFVESAAVDQAMCDNAGLTELPTVPGTMTLHQIIVDCSITPAFRYRDVSCFVASWLLRVAVMSSSCLVLIMH